MMNIVNKGDIILGSIVKIPRKRMMVILHPKKISEFSYLTLSPLKTLDGVLAVLGHQFLTSLYVSSLQSDIAYTYCQLKILHFTLIIIVFI